MKNLNIEKLYNISEHEFVLPGEIAEIYGPFGFPKLPEKRPFTASNFVMGLDGIGSFRELEGRAGGKEVSRSREDRWLMDFLRAHFDAQIIGASTLREEPGIDGKGWDFRIEDEELIKYRQFTLKLGKTRVLVVSGSGDLDLSFSVFNSPYVEPWVITTKTGADKLKSRLNGRKIKIISIGEGDQIDLREMMTVLRKEHGIKTLLCEGGPSLNGQLLEARLLDEEFRTISCQVLGKSTNPKKERPTTYGRASFVPETAPWERLISIHFSPPYHLFLRLRYEGQRKFEE